MGHDQNTIPGIYGNRTYRRLVSTVSAVSVVYRKGQTHTCPVPLYASAAALTVLQPHIRPSDMHSHRRRDLLPYPLAAADDGGDSLCDREHLRTDQGWEEILFCSDLGGVGNGQRQLRLRQSSFSQGRESLPYASGRRGYLRRDPGGRPGGNGGFSQGNALLCAPVYPSGMYALRERDAGGTLECGQSSL